MGKKILHWSVGIKGAKAGKVFCFMPSYVIVSHFSCHYFWCLETPESWPCTLDRDSHPEFRMYSKGLFLKQGIENYINLCILALSLFMSSTVSLIHWILRFNIISCNVCVCYYSSHFNNRIVEHLYNRIENYKHCFKCLISIENTYMEHLLMLGIG